MIQWKSDFFDKIKQELFRVVLELWYGRTSCTLKKKKKTLLRKARGEQHQDTLCYFEQILKATPPKTVAVWQLTSHHTNYPRKTSKTYRTLLGK